MPRRIVLLLVYLVLMHGAAVRGETDAAKLVPETAVWYAELPNPGPLLDFALAPKIHKLLENVEGYQKYLRSEQYPQFQAVVNLLEMRLGTTWDEAVRDLLGGGISAHFDPATNSGFIAIRSRMPELLAKLNSTLAELIEADAKMKGRPSSVKSKQYQGFTGWSFGGDEAHVIIDDLLLITNKTDALKSAVDRYRDPAAKNLAANADFAQVRSKQAAGAIGWSWLNLAAIRQDANVQQGLNKRSDNPVIELLLAGAIEAIKQAPYATSSITYDAGILRLRTELPHRASAANASRAWYFARQAGETALTPPGTIGTFTMFRDLAGLWLVRDELFDERIVAQLAQADTNLGLFFSGRDFGPEVLGELESPVQLIVARQEYGSDAPTPALKLPSFGVVLKLKHADDFAPELLMAYQKVIGIVNITGGQQGKPQLLLSTEEYQGTTISKSAYLRDSKLAKEKAPVQYNFNPACARIGDHFVFGSTVGIVRQAVDALKRGKSAAALTDNTAFTVDAAPLAAILADNKELLITQNMLSQGHSRSEAETAVQTVLDLLAQLDGFVLRLADESGNLTIETRLGLRGAGK